MCLLGLSDHLLSDRYRTIHNIYLHARVGSLGVRGVLKISHQLEIKTFQNRFYGVELDLKRLRHFRTGFMELS